MKYHRLDIEISNFPLSDLFLFLIQLSLVIWRWQLLPGHDLDAISIPIQTLIKQLVQSFYLWRNNSPVFSAELNLITGCIKTKAVGS